jgi:RNA polymerase sigma-70 factor (ECF subfamily)
MNPSEQESRIVESLTAIQLPLRIYIQSLLPGDSAAADVAQQANALIWRKRDTFEIGTNFKAWSFAIARYEVLNYRKRQARDSMLVFSNELEETIAEELSGRSDTIEHRHEVLQACMAKLRPSERKLLLHRYASAGTLQDFAEQTGRSVGGLKVTLFRLRSALLQCINKGLDGREATT